MLDSSGGKSVSSPFINLSWAVGAIVITGTHKRSEHRRQIQGKSQPSPVIDSIFAS